MHNSIIIIIIIIIIGEKPLVKIFFNFSQNKEFFFWVSWNY